MSNTKNQKILDVIRNSFPGTLKEPAGNLKHPYISPGGVYAADLWDWDSYWTIRAMIEISKKFGDKELLEKVKPYARGVFFNFIEHQGKDGSLPIMMTPEDEDPFDCKASPENNMAKPFLGQLAAMLLKAEILSPSDLKETCYNIRDFHLCYKERFQDPGTGLFFWGSDLGIGVDDDPSAWGRPRNSCANLMLNTFMYCDYLAAAEVSDAVGRPDYAGEYRNFAAALKESLQKYCWDAREKAFFSADIQCRANIYPHRYWGKLNSKLDPFWRCLKLKVLSWSSILPLWAGIGTQEQIDAFVKEHFVPERLMSKFGVRSLSADEPMYAPEVARGNPSNWLGPIWILTNYIACDTLAKNGHKDMADDLAARVIGMLSDDLEGCGVFHEYYSPETGRGITSPGFMSWNALATLMLKA